MISLRNRFCCASLILTVILLADGCSFAQAGCGPSARITHLSRSSNAELLHGRLDSVWQTNEQNGLNSPDESTCPRCKGVPGPIDPYLPGPWVEMRPSDGVLARDICNHQTEGLAESPLPDAAKFTLAFLDCVLRPPIL